MPSDRCSSSVSYIDFKKILVQFKLFVYLANVYQSTKTIHIVTIEMANEKLLGRAQMY
jgi:hypothetical protein